MNRMKAKHKSMRSKKRNEWPKSWMAAKRKALVWAKHLRRQLTLPFGE